MESDTELRCVHLSIVMRDSYYDSLGPILSPGFRSQALHFRPGRSSTIRNVSLADSSGKGVEKGLDGRPSSKEECSRWRSLPFIPDLR